MNNSEDSIRSRLLERKRQQMSSTQPEVEGKEISWDDPDIRDAQPEYNDADMSAYKLPPDNKDYQVKLKLGDKGIYPKKSEKQGAFAVAHLEMSFVAPGEWYDGRRVNMGEYLTSITMRDSGTSGIVDLMTKLDGPQPKGMLLPELAKKFKNLLEQEPIISARLKWIAQSRAVQEAHENDDDPNHSKYASSIYREGIFINGMRNFPQKDGDYLTEVKDPITDEDVRARLKLIRFIKE